MEFFPFIAIAILVEGLISYGETLYKNHIIKWQVIIAIILSFIFCYDTNLNFFSSFGLIEKWPILGTIATALILSRGSNYFFELYSQLSS